ncbi:hypothetical protein K4H28_11050 [Deefgea tanakiae]|uniref:Uncharacterized protein n=1 Tax=Deefgea tanakiae TaxID=2865840 RepID=A0ABX8Z2Q9_9NEIS|nr:hypothetical protein [Deefgea tanakiae]QZA76852.1 hypothetical protein K4H28_11050 [Deefgea tanakiae]
MSNEEYQRLKVFFSCFVDWFIPEEHKSKNPEDHPSVFLRNLELTSMPNAKKGLQMAINDIVEMSSEWRADQVSAADARFLSQETFTLSAVRYRFSKRFQQISKRGVIRNQMEYYLIKGIVDGSLSKNSVENLKLADMLLVFEESAKYVGTSATLSNATD